MGRFKRRGQRSSPAGGIGAKLRGYLAPPVRLPPEAAEGAPAALPGLVMAIAVHEGDRVDFVARASMAALGGAEAVQRQAMGNLETLAGIDVVREEVMPHRTDTTIFTLSGADPFVGSRAAVLDWLVEELTGATSIDHGLLVAVPSRHRLVVHVVSGPGAVKVGETMALAAHHMYGTAGAAAISPWVYFVAPDRRAQRVSNELSRGGEIVFEATDLFVEALRSVT
jgi:hypothetical protein